VKQLEIINVKGLHARASAKLVEVVEGFDATAEVSKDGLSASGDSIMGLLMLAASKGTTIEVQTSGADAEALADAIEALVADRFGEDM
jgi:phosphocarrier protein